MKNMGDKAPLVVFFSYQRTLCLLCMFERLVSSGCYHNQIGSLFFRCFVKNLEEMTKIKTGE